MSRRIIINLVVFALIASAFSYWALTNIVHVAALEHPFTVKADFPAAFGVLKNSEVTYLGTQIGDVRTTRRIPGGVEVIMQFKHGKLVPRDSFVQIARKSAIGEPFVNFTPAPDGNGQGPYLRSGDTIPIERASVPLEFADLLRAASRLVAAIPPDDLHTVVSELAVGLHGRTDDLRTLTEDGDKLASALADRTATLDRLATNNTRLTAVVAAHAGSLDATLSDLRAVSASLRAAKDDIGPLLDRGNALLADLAPLVKNHRGDLNCLLATVGRVIDATSVPQRVSGLGVVLDQLPTAFDRVFDATDLEDSGNGTRRWVRVGFLENTSGPPPQFVPEKPTPPPVPAIGACPAVSNAAPARVVARAAGDAVPVLPATGGASQIVAGFFAMLMGSGTWRLTKRARQR